MERMPGHVYQRVKRIIEALRDDPRPVYAERLRGDADRYKIVVGHYRIVYAVEDEILRVLVLNVGR